MHLPRSIPVHQAFNFSCDNIILMSTILILNLPQFRVGSESSPEQPKLNAVGTKLVLEVRYIQGGPTVYPLVTYLAFVLSWYLCSISTWPPSLVILLLTVRPTNSNSCAQHLLLPNACVLMPNETSFNSTGGC